MPVTRAMNPQPIRALQGGDLGRLDPSLSRRAGLSGSSNRAGLGATVREMGRDYAGLVNPDSMRPVVLEDDGLIPLGNPFMPIFMLGLPAVEEADCDETPAIYTVSFTPTGSGSVDRYVINVDIGADFALRSWWTCVQGSFMIWNFTDPRGELIFDGKFGAGISPAFAAGLAALPIFPEIIYPSGCTIAVQGVYNDAAVDLPVQIALVGAHLYKR